MDILSGLVGVSAVVNALVLLIGYERIRDRMLLFLLLPRAAFFGLWVLSISPSVDVQEQGVLTQVAFLILLWTDLMYHSLSVSVLVK